MSGSDLPSLRGWPELLAEIARHPHAGGAAAALRLAACHGGQRIWIPNRAAGSRIERDLGPALAAALVDLRGGLFVSVPRFHARLAEERRRVVLTHPGRSANDLAAELGISYRMVQKIRASARPDPRQTSLFEQRCEPVRNTCQSRNSSVSAPISPGTAAMLDLADYRDPRRHSVRQFVLSREGLDHIRRFEGFRAHAYDDLRPDAVLHPGSRIEGTLTIGHGHTGPHAFIGNEITERQAELLLIEDVSEAEAELKFLVRVPVTQGEYDALVSFLFNVGLPNLRRSTLLRKLNAGDHDGAAMEFSRWVYSKGRRLKGLKLRRLAEAAMFEGTAKLGLVDPAALGAEAEDLPAIGSNVRPDAVIECGVAKPLTRSRTILGAVLGALPLGGLGTAWAVFGDLDWRVQMAALGLATLAFVFLIVNRVREHRVGEH